MYYMTVDRYVEQEVQAIEPIHILQNKKKCVLYMCVYTEVQSQVYRVSVGSCTFVRSFVCFLVEIYVVMCMYVSPNVTLCM